MTNKLINRMISLLYRHNQCYFAKKLVEYSIPIDVGQIPSLMQVYGNPGISQNGISVNAGVDKGMVARSVKQLEDTGLIVRLTDENDKRINRIYPTQKGLDIKDKVFMLIKELHGILYRGFDHEEIQLAFSFIERMKDNIERYVGG